ncbi:MAG: dihydrolipoyllysine-residue acetyltransferase [Pseudomonadota bacterium]|nr:dihydrolipoyllysine-residue acetyltransferase [Pseudomonadota bacterium]
MARSMEINVPDIGDFENVDVVEVLVKPGDTVAAEQPIITLESDKAALDVPSPVAGEVEAMHVNVGDKVSEGTLIATVRAQEGVSEETEQETAQPPPESAPSGKAADNKPESPKASANEQKPKPVEKPEAPPAGGSPRSAPATGQPEVDLSQAFTPHASPGVRRFARELGVDLTKVSGTGAKQRILKEDVQRFVKQQLQAVEKTGGIPVIPEVDFAKFGEIEVKPLSRIKRLSGPNLHRSWLNIPHVTQFDEADITELEDFRKENLERAQKRDVKLTLLAFLLDACASTLKEFPHVNASLDPSGENLIYKRYIHIGVAVDTGDGLVVPVVKDADKKGIFELAKEVSELAELARNRRLKPEHLQGATFSISSLGGIGGTAFTPIINAPEVAILGVSRARMQPVFQSDGSFAPRLILPLSFSYDHRVIDGADAARFTRYLSDMLSDIRRLLL